MRRMTPELLGELIAIHAQCVLDQMGKCTLTVFLKSLCWEINQVMGVTNEEDRGFRRVDQPLVANDTHDISAPVAQGKTGLCGSGFLPVNSRRDH
jgi:hypothetical protein